MDEEQYDDEKVAEFEIRAAREASINAPTGGTVTGLGPSTAPLYLKIRPTHKPRQYSAGPSAKPRNGNAEEEKPLLLTYFAIPGLGEAIRILLAEVGADYDHLAVVGGELQALAADWRARSPNGLLPTASGWGVPRAHPIGQSGAVLRYLARRCGLKGRTEPEAARADALYECAKDMGRHEDEISAEDPERDMAAYKLPFAAAARVEKTLSGMPDPSDRDAALNFGQIQLFALLRKCEIRRGGVRSSEPGREAGRL